MTIGLYEGQSYAFTDSDMSLGYAVANAQHKSSGSRGTRDAGSNLSFRLKGVLGEIGVARMMGITPQVVDLGGPTTSPDIILSDGTQIEVKTGVPMEAKSKLRTDAWYVVVSIIDGWCRIERVRHGEDVLEHAIEPPAYMCPRPGTQQLNWLI